MKKTVYVLYSFTRLVKSRFCNIKRSGSKILPIIGIFLAMMKEDAIDTDFMIFYDIGPEDKKVRRWNVRRVCGKQLNLVEVAKIDAGDRIPGWSRQNYRFIIARCSVT